MTASAHLNPFTDFRTPQPPGPMVVAAQGMMLRYDDGREMLDAMAGLGCVNVGYGREELVEAAHQAMARLSYCHSFGGTRHQAAEALAERLCARAPAHLNRVFFANSGSEANETILKLLKAYWQARGEGERRIILSRAYAYHGSTYAAGGLNGLAATRHGFGEQPPEVVHLPAPYWYREGGAQDPESFALACARMVQAAVDKLGAHRIAGFIGEPVQCSGGGIVPHDAYWPEVARLCRAHDIPIIVDEVVTAPGRTGSDFAFKAFGLKPDFVTLAKGLASGYQPIGAALVSDRIADTVLQAIPFSHGFTTSAHPVAAAVALANLDLIERDGLIAGIRNRLGPAFAAALAPLAEHPMVGEIRQAGLVIGIELVADKQQRQGFAPEVAICGQVADACRQRGIIIRPTGNSLVICPPFIITEAQIAQIAACLSAALDEVWNRQAGLAA